MAPTLTLATDESWRATTAEIRSADLYDGCINWTVRHASVALRRPPGLDTTDWRAAAKVPLGRRRSSSHAWAPPVRVTAVLATDRIRPSR